MTSKWVTLILALAAVIHFSCGLPTFVFPESNHHNLQDAAGQQTQSRDSRFEIPREDSEQQKLVKKDPTQQLQDGVQDSMGPHKHSAQEQESQKSVDITGPQNDSPQQAQEGVDTIGSEPQPNSEVDREGSRSKLPTPREEVPEDLQRNKEQQVKAGTKISKTKDKLGNQKNAQPSGQGELKRNKRLFIPGPGPFLPGPMIPGPFIGGPMPFPIGRMGIAVPAPFPGVVAGPFLGPPIAGGIGVGVAGPFFP